MSPDDSEVMAPGEAAVGVRLHQRLRMAIHEKADRVDVDVAPMIEVQVQLQVHTHVVHVLKLLHDVHANNFLFGFCFDPFMLLRKISSVEFIFLKPFD